MSKITFRQTHWWQRILVLLLFLIGASQTYAAPAGYSEFYIPGDEDLMLTLLEEIGSGSQGTLMHAVITVTGWAQNTQVYYDHWEDGYDFDPDDPTTADETHTLTSRGASRQFISSNIPTGGARSMPTDCYDATPTDPPVPVTNCYYDGKDRVYVAGGTATVTRASWTEASQTYLSLAWEIYPVRPQLTTYILPFGEELANTPSPDLQDFERVFALIQGTQDGTVVQFDLDGNGTLGDSFSCVNNPTICTGTQTQITLDKGEVFLLDQDATGGSLDTGTKIQGTETLQVHYVIGDEGSSYEIRGLTAFPRGFWDDEYYAPVPGPSDPAYTNDPDPVDLYLYNPHSTSLTITYETRSGTGTFTIPATSTRSFEEATGSYVPAGSGVYLRGSDVFWGVSSIDVAGGDSGDTYDGQISDWGYSLVPAFLLENEHFMGWAPGSRTPGSDPAALEDNSGLFITPAVDNTTVYVDLDNDGTADQTYNLDRLESQYIYDSSDGDMSDANIWATGPYTVTWGQNPDTAGPDDYDNRSLDMGYTTIPGGDFIERVLAIEKTANPEVVNVAAGSTCDYSLVVDTDDFAVNAIQVTDTLPSGWEYICGAGNTTITLADKTTVTGSSADPACCATSCSSSLVWPSTTLQSMAANQEITITFTAQIESPTQFSVGDLTRNISEAQGTRIVQGVTQTFVTRDFAFNTYTDSNTDINFTKSSDAADPLNPGDSFTYTISVENPATATNNLTDIAIYDPLPTGLAYVANSSQVIAPMLPFVLDQFGSVSFSNQDGTINWEADWVEVDGNGLGAGTGSVWITGGELRLNDLPNTGGQPSVAREVDLSGGYTTASFSFDYGNNAVETGDIIVVEVSGTGCGGGYTTLATFNGLVSGSAEYDISSYISADTCMRFRVSQNYGGGGEYFYADNVQIRANYDTYRDNFTTQAYNRSDGTLDWSANSWIETNDNGNPATGLIYISGGELFNDDDPATIEREADLSSFLIAQLAFDFRTTGGIDVADVMNIDISDDGGATYTTLDTITGITGATTGSRSYDISNYISSNTRVRFAAVPGGYSGSNEALYVDNFRIGGPTSLTMLTASGGNAPNFVSAGYGYSLAPGQTLTLTFDVTVDDPLPTTVGDQITNTASVTTSQFPVPIQDSVTHNVVKPAAESAEVGDRVWFDTDGDGVLDVGEPGIANVKVTLKDEFGTPVATTTTNGLGYYLFSGVEPGDDYYVEVDPTTLPAGVTQSAPSGHSDDRTDAFDLTAGQSYLDADLGYEPVSGTATIGDLVWSDADGDGVRDPGEPGISDVDVVLYLDDGNGTFESGTDQVIMTTTTTADGSYLFTGIVPSGSQDYFVYVDETQTELSAYTRTTPSSNAPLISDVNTTDNAVILDVDFGYQPDTVYTYTDRIWLDEDEDGDDDNPGNDDAETGIANVTVDLLDASLNVVATTTTDADGYFSFSGLAGDGADYTVSITDTNGVLADYYGTTSAAAAGSFELTNVGTDLTDLNYTDETGDNRDPNFGYYLRGAIGDTVFTDLGGTYGVQDSGEPGISGVTIELYLDVDGDGNFEPGGDDGSVIATLITDVNGKYIFSGLDDGTYWVDIDNSQIALSGYNTLTTPNPEDDTTASGHQRLVTISGGNNDLTADFGYRYGSTPRSISGTVWQDLDEEGDIDGGESRFENVTVELWKSGIPIATTTTDANGDYSFSGLNPDEGPYTVKVTDAYSVLSGDYTTYEFTEGTSGPFDGQEVVDLSSGDQTNINFGYNSPFGPTVAIVSSFTAYEQNGRTVIQWETASEVRTIGFYLQRFDETIGEYLRVSEKLLPGLFVSLMGGTYRYVDNGAQPGGSYVYQLVEVEASGKERIYGPFSVTVQEGGILSAPLQQGDEFESIPTGQTAAEAARSSIARERQAMSDRIRKYRRWKQAIKIAVTENDLYYVDGFTISELLGLSLQQVRKLIQTAGLSLHNRGREVAYLPDEQNTGIYFYGEGIDSMYTLENIYWLKVGRGKHIETIKGDGPAHADSDQTFTETLHVERDRWAILSVFNDPQGDYWIWDYLYTGYPGYERRRFPFMADGVASSGEATLTVYLKGGKATPANPDHHVVVYLNGTLLGEGMWDNKEAYTLVLPFDQSLLHDGDNTLEIVGGSAAPRYAFTLIDSFELTFQRHYQAVDNRLFARGEDHPVVTISGLTQSDISVFNVTDPLRSQLLTATSIDTALNRVSFKSASPDSAYLVVPLNQARTPDTIVADEPSQLKQGREGADYVVIAPLELQKAAQALADYRQSQGLETMVVDPEDIYDEFHDGLASPEAIKDFLAYAYCNWTIPPRYVVLAGEGTYDYKDNQGYGDNMVPTLFVDTPFGLYPSDNKFGDVVGDDRVPEMVVGRLPAVSEQELYALLDKIRAYESHSGDTWRKQVLMVSDNPDTGGDFPTDSADVASLVSPDYAVQSISLAEVSATEVRQGLVSRINAGALLVNYLGHGGMHQLASEGILRVSDVSLLNNAERLPVLTALTCSTGMFALPGYDSLSETLVVKPDGGAIAVWAPTGMSLNSEAKILNTAFFRAFFEHGEFVLGEMILDALKTYKAQNRLPYLLDIYALLGDPALRMRPESYVRRDERVFAECRQEVLKDHETVIAWKSGSGTGTLMTETQSCGPECQSLNIPYVANDVVLLEAFPAEDSSFVGWQDENGFFIETLQYYLRPGEIVVAVFEKKP